MYWLVKHVALGVFAGDSAHATGNGSSGTDQVNLQGTPLDQREALELVQPWRQRVSTHKPVPKDRQGGNEILARFVAARRSVVGIQWTFHFTDKHPVSSLHVHCSLSMKGSLSILLSDKYMPQIRKFCPSNLACLILGHLSTSISEIEIRQNISCSCNDHSHLAKKFWQWKFLVLLCVKQLCL